MLFKNWKIAASAAAFCLATMASAHAYEISQGPGGRGIKFTYDTIPLGSSTNIRTQLQCRKSSSGSTSGVASVVAYYQDESGQWKQEQRNFTCSVNGGLDGKAITNTSPPQDITVKKTIGDLKANNNIFLYVFMGHEDTSIYDQIMKNLTKQINNQVSIFTAGLAKDPIDLQQVSNLAIPNNGVLLKF